MLIMSVPAFILYLCEPFIETLVLAGYFDEIVVATNIFDALSF